MDRLACVDLAAFPLQLLLKRHPEWRGAPVVVVEHDRPHGEILWADETARGVHVRPGMRYAQGLSLCRTLRAGVVSRAEVEGGVQQVVRLLQAHSPEVEPNREEPGVFWLNASGLVPLYGSLEVWAREVHRALEEGGYSACVVVGFTRHATYALARAWQELLLDSVAVLEDPGHEAALLRRVPIACLGIPPDIQVTLSRLDVRTVGEFLELPARMVRRRLGDVAYRQYRRFAGSLETPFDPAPHPVPFFETTDLDEPVDRVEPLLYLVERHLEVLVRRLAARDLAVAALLIELTYARQGEGTAEALHRAAFETRRVERVRPGAPTLDPGRLLELARLRLEGLRLEAGVVRLRVSVRGVKAGREQLQLFAHRRRRDLAAAGRALARIRAEFGDDAVVTARLRDGYLPEAEFAWVTADRVVLPRPGGSHVKQMVRRIFSIPERLAPRSRREPDGWLLRGAGHGHVVDSMGPFIVSGAWWDTSVHREYHFAETRDGSVFWVYYDRPVRRWFLQGVVE